MKTRPIAPFPFRVAASLLLPVSLAVGLYADTPQATYDPSTGLVTLSEAGKTILVYHYQNAPIPDGFFDGIPENHLKYARKFAIPRSNYIHPLNGPEGTALTADWNTDHPHHRGIYWAWPEVGYQGETGDLHALQKVWARPTGKIETRQGDDWAEVTAENRWMWKDKTPIVHESATIRVWKAGDHGRHIDLAFKFEALEEGVTLARRVKTQYGGLNIRLAKIQDMNLAHHADPDETAPGMAWQLASGTWEGAGSPASLVVFEASDNPGYPADYMQFPKLPWFQPAFPAAGTRHELPKARPLVLRYRLWIRPGAPPTERELRDQWTNYQQTTAKP